MSTSVSHSEEATLALPSNPDLRHLRDQAKDLVTSGEAAKLSEAQYLLARRYGFASWPRLKAHVESLQEVGQLKAAISANDFSTVRRMMTANPKLHQAPMGYGDNGPLTWVAECRIPREAPSETRLEMARWMIENGSDVHQGGDGPLMRAALMDYRIPMMELLVAHGADVNALWGGRYPILFAPCETLQPGALRWLLNHGADPTGAAIPAEFGNPVAFLVAIYARNPRGKRECLDIFADGGYGYTLPDTAPMAVHRSRIDLLEAHLARDPDLLRRRWSEAEIYPPELGIAPGVGLTMTEVVGGTLLHLAVEMDDPEVTAWLLTKGADPNARAETNAENTGHTPLFHAVVTLGRKDDTLARLLLKHGANPTIRATLRKRYVDLSGQEGESFHEFPNVTPVEYARRFPDPHFINESAIVAVETTLPTS